MKMLRLTILAAIAAACGGIAYADITSQVQGTGLLSTFRVLASGITVTGAQPGISLPAGPKTFQATVVTSSGAGSATVAIEAMLDGLHWDPIGTLSPTNSSPSDLTGGDSVTFVAPAYWQYRINITAISGTGAAVNVNMGR